MEEVTESYVLLSPQTYPQGGFNCQSSLRFLKYPRLTESRLSVLFSGAEMTHLEQNKCPSEYLVKPFAMVPMWKTNLSRPDRWNQMPVLHAEGNPNRIHPGLLISTRKIGECGAAVKSVTAKDKRGRKNKRTDRSVFTALCLFTVRQAKLAISFSVPPKAQDMKATLFFCKWP